MRHKYQYVSWIISGVFLFGGFMYVTHTGTTSARTHTVYSMLMLKHTNVEHRYTGRCFHLFSSSSHFRSAVESKTRVCGYVTYGEWKGRVGNQMFQVAAVIGIAHHLDKVPVINVKNLEIAKYFSFPTTLTPDISNVVKCYEKGSAIYSDCSGVRQNATLHNSNIMVDGFRQSWKYVANVTAYIRNMFEFKAYYINKAREFITNNTILGHDNVCIHVRRRDFITSGEQSVGRTVADTNFLSRAMQFYQRKLKSRVRFIVLSDDIVWCRRNMKGNDVKFSPYSDPGVDLAIMSLCDHVVVTSGTFGWWGAWLSNGTVVYYHGYPRKDSAFYKRFNSDDYYPRHWIKL